MAPLRRRQHPRGRETMAAIAPTNAPALGQQDPLPERARPCATRGTQDNGEAPTERFGRLKQPPTDSRKHQHGQCHITKLDFAHEDQRPAASSACRIGIHPPKDQIAPVHGRSSASPGKLCFVEGEDRAMISLPGGGRDALAHRPTEVGTRNVQQRAPAISQNRIGIR